MWVPNGNRSSAPEKSNLTGTIMFKKQVSAQDYFQCYCSSLVGALANNCSYSRFRGRYNYADRDPTLSTGAERTADVSQSALTPSSRRLIRQQGQLTVRADGETVLNLKPEVCDSSSRRPGPPVKCMNARA
jgi:hypothetical protein